MSVVYMKRICSTIVIRVTEDTWGTHKGHRQRNQNVRDTTFRGNDGINIYHRQERSPNKVKFVMLYRCLTYYSYITKTYWVVAA
jgi:hypothetical protein